MNLFLLEYAFRDLLRQKTRTFLGIFGVGVSILLLTSVSFLTDSLSASFIDYLTTDAGNQDIVITARSTYSGYYRGYFEYQQIVDQIMENVSEVSAILPRFYLYGRTNGTLENPNPNATRTQIIGLNFTLENDVGYGKLRNYDINAFNPAVGLPQNTCIVEKKFADSFNISQGAVLSFNSDYGHKINLTVISLFEHQLKFQSADQNLILVDINWFGSYLNELNKTQSLNINRSYSFVGKANVLVVILKDAARLYDVRNVQGSENTIMKIGEKIQLTIGLSDFNLTFPKLEFLFISEYISMTFQVVFVFIGIIAMLISGILIHGILTTSVEERIREYGINRVLGARRSYNLYLIVIQGLILCVIGTSFGIFGAYLLVSKGLLPFINRFIPEGFLSNELQFVAQPTSIILSYVIGIGISMFVSIAPALKVMKMRLIESINPYRHEEVTYEIKRDTGTNYKLIIFGLLLAFNGGLFYFLIPQLLLSMEFGLIASVLIGILLIFLIGVTLMGIGLMPLIQRVVLNSFTPFIRKLINIIKITIYRYQRRNLSTVVMFCLSFSFIMFTTSMVEIIQNQTSALIRFNNGADLQMIAQSSTINNPTEEIQQLLMNIEGIERVCSYFASPNDLSDIYGPGRYSKEFIVEMGDFINLYNQEVFIYAPDENYPHVIYQEYMTMKGGSPDDVFSKIFSNPEEPNCIISESLAVTMNLKIGDNVRLTFTRGEEKEIVIFTIVGISANMPGMPRFKGNSFRANRAGVIISQELYVRYMNVPRPAWVDRVLIKLDDGADAKQVAQRIQAMLGKEYDFFIRNTQAEVESDTELFYTAKVALQLVLIGTVIICLFSLISASYSSILERQREIAVLRTLGLRPNEVELMFRNEALITLISSGTTGSIIGFLTAALLSENMIVLIETPRMWAIPWDVVGLIFGVSIATLLLGMKMLLRRIRKENIMKIYRATT